MYDVFVIKGNVAIFKCNIPSFVSDHVEIIEWTDTEGGVYSTEAKFGITSKRKRLIFKRYFHCFPLSEIPFCELNHAKFM